MSGCFSIRVRQSAALRIKYQFLLLMGVLFLYNDVSAQHYTAINGSEYFGSLNVYNNPATIVTAPYKWDLTLFGTQYTTITNAIRGKNFPLYAAPSAKFSVANGNYARHANFNYNVRLLNARYSINKRQAIAFGLNFKGYTQASTSSVNYNDSVKGPLSFLSINEQNRTLRVKLASSAWMEVYGTYAFTLMDNEMGKLTGGATLKISRGMSGLYANADNVGVVKSTEGDRYIYKLANGNARYGYSANHGDFSSFSAGDLFSNSQTGFSVDFGVEYMIKTQDVTNVYDDVETDGRRDFDWKLGFALLDLGSNNYLYGSQSRRITTVKDNTTSTVLQDKFFGVKNLTSFNDSLATIVNEAKVLSGNFGIANPARAVFSVDRHFSGNFFVNGELSLNIFPAGADKQAVKESNLLTVTPRWENRKFGFYAPVQVTQQGNFWIGAAVKAGPLLLGTHNLLNIFSSNAYLSGGAYIAFILRPSGFMKSPQDRRNECPAF